MSADESLLSFTTASREIIKRLHQAEIVTLDDAAPDEEELYAYRMRAFTSIVTDYFPSATTEQIALLELDAGTFFPERVDYVSEKFTRVLMREFAATPPRAIWE
ncbi:hypothetical protein [Oleiharenicola lentus]|uniref:hypothetical protein n=1 Tax=Oleiharenicola lentus TaxID=2508720 RepID=UPI003F67402C